MSSSPGIFVHGSACPSRSSKALSILLCTRTTTQVAEVVTAEACIISFTLNVHRSVPSALSAKGRHTVCQLGHKKMVTPAAPGQILAGRLASVGVHPTDLARQLRVPPNRITQIIQGKRGITGDSALRLEHRFGDAPEYWMGLQIQHELRVTAQHAGREIFALPRHPVPARAA